MVYSPPAEEEMERVAWVSPRWEGSKVTSALAPEDATLIVRSTWKSLLSIWGGREGNNTHC